MPDLSAWVPVWDAGGEVEVMAKRRNKYGAKKTRYGLRTYDSIAEARRAAELDVMLRGGEVQVWVAQPNVELARSIRYKPDFLVVGTDGRAWFEDVKGMETQAFRQIKSLWEEHGPAELHVRYAKQVEVIVPEPSPQQSR